jgi:hypothetical protein
MLERDSRVNSYEAARLAIEALYQCEMARGPPHSLLLLIHQ